MQFLLFTWQISFYIYIIFLVILRVIFPGVGQVKVQVPGGSVEVHYNNLKRIDSPEPDYQEGVNHIMASVLFPINAEAKSLGTKTKVS